MRSLFVSVCALMLTVAAPAASEKSWPGLAIADPITRYAVYWALTSASRWLAKPQCRSVLGEFRDQSGNLLSDNLGQLALDEVRYLRQLRFRDGSGSAMCSRPRTVMFTAPGSRVVFVCASQFREMVVQDRGGLGVFVIHEMLHTLGLGENPPSSQEITRRVTDRCRR